MVPVSVAAALVAPVGGSLFACPTSCQGYKLLTACAYVKTPYKGEGRVFVFMLFIIDAGPLYTIIQKLTGWFVDNQKT